jgi:hypothetical protein
MGPGLGEDPLQPVGGQLRRLHAELGLYAAGDLQQLGRRHVQVPQPQGGQLGEAQHRFAVGADGDPGGVVLLPARAAVLPGRHGHARRQPQHVPFPRARQGLVEVVEAEHQVPLGRAEQAEVDQVGVAAQLHGDPAGRHARQVVGHDRRAAAEERERRRQHPAVADRDQVRFPSGRLRLEDLHRVRPVRCRLPPRVQASGRPPPRRPPRRPACLDIRAPRTRRVLLHPPIPRVADVSPLAPSL